MQERLYEANSAPDFRALTSKEQNPAWVENLTSELESHNVLMYRHSVRVSFISPTIGKFLGLNDSELKLLRIAGLLHDAGKINVPNDILNNTSQNLTKEQRDILDKHPRDSFAMISPYDSDIARIVVSHHEVHQARKYPRQIERTINDPLLKLTEIVSLADKTDASLSNRTYHKGEEPETVFSILSKVCDPNLARLSIEAYQAIPQRFLD